VRHQKTGILANGDSGFELSSLISNWTTDLTLFTNGESTLTAEQSAKLHKHQIKIVEKEISGLEHKGGYIKNIFCRRNKGAAESHVCTPRVRTAFLCSAGIGV
jgi:thioredoxin reductase